MYKTFKGKMYFSNIRNEKNIVLFYNYIRNVGSSLKICDEIHNINSNSMIRILLDSDGEGTPQECLKQMSTKQFFMMYLMCLLSKIMKISFPRFQFYLVW